jgi:hypothetical protein
MSDWNNQGELPVGWSLDAAKDETEVWARFKKKFQFSPSTEKSDWPSIKERSPSVTYALQPFNEIDLEATWHGLMTVFKNISHNEQDEIYVLHWQHGGYVVNPKKLGEDWIVHPIPNGDSYIFIDPEFKFGIFGHPWEWTMNVFGEPLIQEVKKQKIAALSEILRKN